MHHIEHTRPVPDSGEDRGREEGGRKGTTPQASPHLKVPPPGRASREEDGATEHGEARAHAALVDVGQLRPQQVARLLVEEHLPSVRVRVRVRAGVRVGVRVRVRVSSTCRPSPRKTPKTPSSAMHSPPSSTPSRMSGSACVGGRMRSIRMYEARSAASIRPSARAISSPYRLLPPPSRCGLSTYASGAASAALTWVG